MIATDSKKLLEKPCCAFYDLFLIPCIYKQHEMQEQNAEILKSFLKKMGLSYNEFYQAILDYSLGFGLDYLDELNDIILDHELYGRSESDDWTS